MQNRENFASRLGFLLMAAGCAIGLGNVWRFPYITGKYGGALFVLIYLVFLVILGYPVMLAELAIGRASKSDLPGGMEKLAPGAKGKRWAIPAKIFFTGNLVLLMFYSVVTGWMLAYAWNYLTGVFARTADFGAFFGGFTGSWQQQILFCAVGLIMTTAVCLCGLQKGVERVIKFMMAGLFLLQLVLIVSVLRFDGATEGLKFFLKPSTANLASEGLWPAVHAAMAQAFFTLSLGIGSMEICGSYTGRENTLAKESLFIILLDTAAAIASGLIIFPACAALHVQPDSGPSLIFITLPKVFAKMSGGHFLGILFFLFMSAAALSTLIAVAENIIAYMMDHWSFSRKKASLFFGSGLMILSLPCAFGFNIWKDFQPFGKGSCVLDLEDFVISSNLLPLGSMLIVLFCCTKFGWGGKNFVAEVNTGKGFRIPGWLPVYMKIVLPVLIGGLWLYDLIHTFLRGD